MKEESLAMDESSLKASIQMDSSLIPPFEENMKVQVQVQVNEKETILSLTDKHNEPKTQLGGRGAHCLSIALLHAPLDQLRNYDKHYEISSIFIINEQIYN